MTPVRIGCDTCWFRNRGLALVQRLTHASGGEITLRPAARGGLDAVVRLPPAPRGDGASATAHRPLETAARRVQ